MLWELYIWELFHVVSLFFKNKSQVLPDSLKARAQARGTGSSRWCSCLWFQCGRQCPEDAAMSRTYSGESAAVTERHPASRPSRRRGLADCPCPTLGLSSGGDSSSKISSGCPHSKLGFLSLSPWDYANDLMSSKIMVFKHFNLCTSKINLMKLVF